MLNKEKIIYLDETGIDDNEVYAYAWSIKGERAHFMKNAERSKRLSIISAIHKNNHIAPFAFEGSCDRAVFETYLKFVLIPRLQPGYTIIMDNASFHKGGKITQIIEDAGCQILYLPPYSPDYNPIEHHWAAIKSKIRHFLNYFQRDIYLAVQYAFNLFQYVGI